MSDHIAVSPDGTVTGYHGRAAVDIFRLRVLESGLRFEAKTGMRMSRVSCLKAAKQVTGLRTNDKVRQADAVAAILAAALERVPVEVIP